MDYRGWLVEFNQEGERVRHKLIDFYQGRRPNTDIYALTFDTNNGKLHSVRVSPDDADFVILGEAYRPVRG